MGKKELAEMPETDSLPCRGWRSKSIYATWTPKGSTRGASRAPHKSPVTCETKENEGWGRLHSEHHPVCPLGSHLTS